MTRRTLPAGYTRLPGSSKRVRTPGGSIISDRAYNDIVNLQRLQSGGAAKSGRGLAVSRAVKTGHGLAVARKVATDTAKQTPSSHNPPRNTPPSYRALVTIDGKSHRPMLQGENLDKLNEHHYAVWQWLHHTHNHAALEEWARKYPDAAVYDVNGTAYRIPKNAAEYERAYGRINKKGRKDTNKKYAEDQAA